MLPGNIKATFLWAPYGTNLTAHFKAWCANRTALGLATHGFGLAAKCKCCYAGLPDDWLMAGEMAWRRPTRLF